ncbi:MAG: (Fe-S)-binding protein, partial [Methanomassiliicoccales archaeon]
SQCDFCREGCASYLAFYLDSFSPRGKNRILKAYSQGRLKRSDLISLAYKCTVCAQCQEVCITGDGISNNILKLRAELVKSGLIPKQLSALKKRITEKGSAFDKKDLEWVGDIQAKGGVGYFPGCSLLAYNSDLASKTLDVLEGYGKRASPIVNQCCASPLLRAGLVDEARIVAEQMQHELKEKKIRTLICSCPGCTLTFRKEYPFLVKGWKVKALHISEFLIRKKIKLNKRGSGAKIIYHDPCHLARGLDITSEPRIILTSMGYEVLELQRKEKNGVCCGAGGGLAMLYPNEAEKVAQLKIEEALDANVKQLVTFCPLCVHFLDEAADGRIEIKDVMELI